MEVKLKQIIVILLIVFVSCGNVRSYDYIIQSHSKREIIKSYPISKDKKYLRTFASYDDNEESFSDRNVFPIGCIKELKKIEI